MPTSSIRLFVPPGWSATTASDPSSEIAAFMLHEETGTVITAILLSREEAVDAETVASTYWLTLLHDGYRPTHAPEYRSHGDWATVTFSALTNEGVIKEGRIVARGSQEWPGQILLFVAECPPGHLSEMVMRVDAIAINSRPR